MNAPVLGCSGYSVFNRASAGVRILNGAAGRCGNRLFGSYPRRAASSRSRCRDRNDVGRRTAALDQIAEKFAPGIQCAGLLRQIFIEVVHGADARCLADLMGVDHELANLDRKDQSSEEPTSELQSLMRL